MDKFKLILSMTFLIFCFVCQISEGAMWIPFYGVKTHDGHDREDYFDKKSIFKTQNNTIEVFTKIVLDSNLARGSVASYTDTSLYELNCKNKTYRSIDYSHSDGIWKNITQDGNTEALYQAICLNINSRLASLTPDDAQNIADQMIDESNESFQKGDWDSSIDQASQALYYNPRSEVALTNRAGAYANKGMFREAEEDCNSAIAINPRYGLAYNNRGWVYEQLGQRNRAAADYQTGCNLGMKRACSNLNRIKTSSR